MIGTRALASLFIPFGLLLVNACAATRREPMARYDGRWESLQKMPMPARRCKHAKSELGWRRDLSLIEQAVPKLHHPAGQYLGIYCSSFPCLRWWSLVLCWTDLYT